MCVGVLNIDIFGASSRDTRLLQVNNGD